MPVPGLPYAKKGYCKDSNRIPPSNAEEEAIEVA
jgi:hypothetical protein